MKKTISMLLVGATLTFSTSSCIGSFGLFNNILEWNKGISNKFVGELAFIGLWIVPVYEISLMADALVFNTIEFLIISPATRQSTL